MPRAAISSIFQQQNLIGPLHRAQPVGDDKRRAPFHQPIQRLLNEMFRVRIHTGRGVIQDEDARIGDQRAGNRQALFLPARKRDATFADIGVVAFGHRHE